jgi:hypothetical protein
VERGGEMFIVAATQRLHDAPHLRHLQDGAGI